MAPRHGASSRRWSADMARDGAAMAPRIVECTADCPVDEDGAVAPIPSGSASSRVCSPQTASRPSRARYVPTGRSSIRRQGSASDYVPTLRTANEGHHRARPIPTIAPCQTKWMSVQPRRCPSGVVRTESASSFAAPFHLIKETSDLLSLLRRRPLRIQSMQDELHRRAAEGSFQEVAYQLSLRLVLIRARDIDMGASRMDSRSARPSRS